MCAHLVVMAGSLAVLCEALYCLVDEAYVLLIDVESQQPQASRGAATDTVQELQRLTHQIIVVLVVLTPQKVLERDQGRVTIQQFAHFIHNIYYFIRKKLHYILKGKCALKV